MAAKTYTPQRKKQTIVFDADGTLFEYDHWRGETHVGAPIKPMVAFSRFVDWCGYDVAVSTARTGLGLESIRQAVVRAGIPAKQVTNSKPIGVAYIDDRGIHFSGDADEVAVSLSVITKDPILATFTYSGAVE